jgi:periplasmic protein TonB
MPGVRCTAGMCQDVPSPAGMAGPASNRVTMATPFDLRFLSSKDGLAASTGTHVPPSNRAETSPNRAFARLPDRRHPVGLLVVVGLHVLVAAALLTARLDAAPSQVEAIALTKIDETRPPPPPEPQDLPVPPRSPLRQLVVPVPEVVVERPAETIQAARQEAPPAPPAAAAPTPARGDDGGSLMPRVEAQPTRLNAGAAECRPVYPHVAEREGVTGITKLRFVVDAAGHVSAQLLQSSGPLRQNRRMDEAAIEALSHCPVQVGTDDFGRPVGGTVDVNYKWTIN